MTLNIREKIENKNRLNQNFKLLVIKRVGKNIHYTYIEQRTYIKKLF